MPPHLLQRVAVLAAATGLLPAQLAVTASSPARNSRIEPAGTVTVTFSEPLDPATVTAHAFAVSGHWSGPRPGALTLSADLRTVVFTPSLPLFAGERVSVALAASVTAASGATLDGGHCVQAFVTSAPGSRQFSLRETIALRRSGEGRIGTYGLFAGDLDRDGAPDLTSMNEISNDLRVQHNTGCGSFAPAVRIANPGQWPSPNRGADFDRDGFLDLVTGNQNGGAVSIYQNDGAGGLVVPVVYPTAGYVHGVAAADFDADGYPDVAAPNGNTVSVFRNLGDGTLGAATTYDAGGNGEDNVSACDLDGDGILDLAVGNLYSNTMGVLLGNGDGTFRFVRSWPTGGQPFHQCFGDVDGDGHTDVLFANRGTNTFAVLLGDGAGGFGAPVAYPVGQTPAAIELGDLDGDGDLDCVVANYSSADYSLWWNRGDGIFELPLTLPAAQSGSCSTIVDFDRDGILDLMGADENADVAILYRQDDLGSATSEPPSCASALRVNQRADRAGFGATPPQIVRLGSQVALNLSGAANDVCLYGIAPPYTPGYLIPGVGLLSLDVLQPPYLQVEYLDAKGERTVMLPVPATMPAGLLVALQAAIGNVEFRFSNPQTVVLMP